MDSKKNQWRRIRKTSTRNSPVSIASTLGVHNPLRYRGYVYDQETGLYYLQSRYYNPEWGRFISADTYVSTGQGLLGNNMFAYCGNNPVKMYDKTGFMPKFTPQALQDMEEWVETALGPLLYIKELNSRGYLKEYWVEGSGRVRWSRHHTNHGNSKKHPVVPHDHEWHDDDDGNNIEDKEWKTPDPGFRAPGSDDNSTKEVTKTVSTIAVAYAAYVVIKWAVAALATPVTGGGSLVIAGVAP